MDPVCQCESVAGDLAPCEVAVTVDGDSEVHLFNII